MNTPLLPLLICSPRYHNWEQIDYCTASHQEIACDLAPRSDEYCAAHGIKPAREDFAANEMVELPAPEFRRNVLITAVERVFK